MRLELALPGTSWLQDTSQGVHTTRGATKDTPSDILHMCQDAGPGHQDTTGCNIASNQGPEGRECSRRTRNPTPTFTVLWRTCCNTTICAPSMHACLCTTAMPTCVSARTLWCDPASVTSACAQPANNPASVE
jgi:hypothetical protein